MTQQDLFYQRELPPKVKKVAFPLGGPPVIYTSVDYPAGILPYIREYPPIALAAKTQTNLFFHPPTYFKPTRLLSHSPNVPDYGVIVKQFRIGVFSVSIGDNSLLKHWDIDADLPDLELPTMNPALRLALTLQNELNRDVSFHLFVVGLETDK